MVRPSQTELDRLRIVAGEIITTLEAEGHTVATALSQHRVFRRNRVPASSMRRELVLDGARRGASMAHIHAEPVGIGIELISIDGNIERLYRVKTATYQSGKPHIVVGASSSLLSLTEEPGQLFSRERWVLCFKVDDDDLIDEIFVAEIIGHEGDGPVKLVLGTPYPLEPITPSDGFTPDADDDLGDDFDADDDSDEGVA